MKRYLQFIITILVAAIGTSAVVYYVHRYVQDERCAATRKIKPNYVAHAYQKVDESGGYWSIDLRHIGAKSLPVYWRGNVYPKLLGKTKVYELKGSSGIIIESERISIGKKMTADGSYAFSYLKNAERNSLKLTPVMYPVTGAPSSIMQSFEGVDGRTLRHNTTHKFAVDIRAAKGSRVVAGVGGIVALTEDRYPDSKCQDPLVSNRGNFVIIRTDNGVDVKYGHLQHASVIVSVGERVRRGQAIGRVGASGAASVPHLHLEVGGMTENGYTTVPISLVDLAGDRLDLVPGSNYGKTGSKN